MKRAFFNIAFAIAVVTILPITPAEAYLDGATVSMVLQAITGAVASALIFGKTYWAKVRSIFSRSKTNAPD